MYNTLEPNNCYYYVNTEYCIFTLSPINALKFLKDHCVEQHKKYGNCKNCEITEHCEILECYTFSDLKFEE